MTIIIILTLLIVLLLVIGTIMVTDNNVEAGMFVLLLSTVFIFLDTVLIIEKSESYAKSVAIQYSKEQQDILISKIGNKTVELELYKLEINKKDTLKFYKIKNDSL